MMLRLRPMILVAFFAVPASAQFHDDFTGAAVLPQWTWTDPDADCSFQLGPVAGRLRMTVPHPNDHTTGHPGPLYNGPMLTVPATGDFTITTWVSVNYPGVPAAKESGFLIWKDSSNNLQLKRTNAFNSQNVLFYGNLANPTTTFHGQVNVAANDLFLRIVRSGNTFTGSFGADGRTWTQAGSVSWNVTGPLQVGLSTTYYIWFGTNTGPALGDYDFFDLEPPGAALLADRAGVRGSLGGTVGLALDLGPGRAGLPYLVVGSLSGASPGTPLPGGAVLPINFDSLTSLMIALAGVPGLFPGTVGALDGTGRAAASAIAPAAVLAPLAGTALRFAAVVVPGGAPLIATNAAEVAIVP